MKIIDFLKQELGELKFGTSTKKESIDILSSSVYGYYKTKSKIRNFWDYAYFIILDDSWGDNNLSSYRLQLEEDVINYFNNDVVGEYTFLRSSSSYQTLDYFKLNYWIKNSIDVSIDLNEHFKNLNYAIDKGNFADGFLNENSKIKTIFFCVTSIDWSLIENIPNDLLLIYDENAKQENFPVSETQKMVSFQEIENF